MSSDGSIRPSIAIDTKPRMPIDEYVMRIVRPTAIWPRIFPVNSSSGDTADKITSIVRLDFSSIVVVRRYCPLLMTEIISRMVNPIGNSPAKSARVADSPVAVTVTDGGRATLVSASMRCRSSPAARTRASTMASAAAFLSLVLNAVVEVPPHEQVVVAEHTCVIRHGGVGMNDQHGKLARCGVARQPLLLLTERAHW